MDKKPKKNLFLYKMCMDVFKVLMLYLRLAASAVITRRRCLF